MRAQEARIRAPVDIVGDAAAPSEIKVSARVGAD